MPTSTLSAKVTDLVGGTVDDPALDDWMTEGAKEVINLLPANLQRLCTSMVSFTSQAVGSETSASQLNTGKIFGVFAGSYSCRQINSMDKYKAEDSNNVLYATATDPAYYIEQNHINVLPSGLSCKYEEVTYPTVDVDSVNVISATFPDDAEYLVILYAAIKQVSQYMTD